MVYSKTTVYGGGSLVNPVTCIFPILKHLMMLLKCKFLQGFITQHHRHNHAAQMLNALNNHSKEMFYNYDE